MVLRIKRLIWDEKNTKKIARHYVTVDEVEELIDKYFYIEKTKRRRKLAIGETGDGRVLEVPLQGKGNGRFYPITAYDARPKQAQAYLSAKTKKRGDQI